MWEKNNQMRRNPFTDANSPYIRLGHTYGLFSSISNPPPQKGQIHIQSNSLAGCSGLASRHRCCISGAQAPRRGTVNAMKTFEANQSLSLIHI